MNPKQVHLKCFGKSAATNNLPLACQTSGPPTHTCFMSLYLITHRKRRKHN